MKNLKKNTYRKTNNGLIISLVILLWITLSSNVYAQNINSIMLPEELPKNNQVIDKTPEIKPNINNEDELDTRVLSKRRETFPWQGSLFFENKDMQLIYSALDVIDTDNKDAFNNSFIDDESLLLDAINNKSNNQDSPSEELSTNTKMVTYPSFNLNSVMFSGINDWTIWVNGKRVRSYEQNNEYQIKMSRDNMAYILWNPESYIIEDAILNGSLKNHNKNVNIQIDNGVDFPTNGWNYKAPNSNVYANTNNNIILVGISPGQSLSSYKMNVIEGFSPPIKIESAVENE